MQLKILKKLALGSHLAVSVMYIGGGNSLAHSLAKRVILSADTDVWLEELQQDLIHVFQADLPQ